MSTTEAKLLLPKISIFMAAYNEERDIEKALDSIVEQTFTDWELIIIDDGSTDTKATIIQGYVDKNRIEKLWHLMKYTWMSVKCRDSKTLEADIGDILDNFGSKYRFNF